MVGEILKLIGKYSNNTAKKTQANYQKKYSLKKTSYDNHSDSAKAAQAANWKALGSGSSSSSGSSSKSYTTSSGSSSGGGKTTTKTTQKTETYYERTITTQETIETTTITYKITKDGKTTLDDGSTITDIRLYDSTPENRFAPSTNGIGLDDLFAKCEWNTDTVKSQGDALSKTYTAKEFKAAIIETTTPTNGSEKTGNNIGADGSDIGRIVLNNNNFSYIFGAKSDEYIYDAQDDAYKINDNSRNPNIKYVKNDDSAEITLTYYEDIIRAETNSEWMGRVKNNQIPSFAQIYKKLNDDEVINSISISTTSKFRDYMAQVWGTADEDGNITPLDLDAEAKKGDAKHVLTLFIDNITLHEAKHIPLFYPNVRMKFYHSNNKPDDVDTYNLRKMGAVIEYR